MSIIKIKGQNEKYGLYDDVSHQQILVCEYFEIVDLQYNDLFVVKKAVSPYYGGQSINGSYSRAGLFNARTLQFLIPCENHSIWHYDKNVGLACVVKENDGHSSGYINSNGETIIPFIYDMPWHDNFDTNKAITLCINGEYGVVDTLNRVKLPFQYENIDAGRFELPEQPLSRICKNGLWGFVDRNYNIAISCQYRNVGSYFPIGTYWRSIVTDNNGKQHLINEKGNDVIPSKYSSFGIPIGREYVAECSYWSLFGGWQKEYVSTIDGHIMGSNSSEMDQFTKDLLAKAIIYGSVAAAKGALKIVAAACGTPLPPDGVSSYYSKQIRDKAWRVYKESGSILEALSAMM